jgi:hypothetical protein
MFYQGIYRLTDQNYLFRQKYTQQQVEKKKGGFVLWMLLTENDTPIQEEILLHDSDVFNNFGKISRKFVVNVPVSFRGFLSFFLIEILEFLPPSILTRPYGLSLRKSQQIYRNSLYLCFMLVCLHSLVAEYSRVAGDRLNHPKMLLHSESLANLVASFIIKLLEKDSDIMDSVFF